MVGSRDSIGSPNTVLNTIVAEAFCEAADILEKADNFDMAVHDLIKEYMTEHRRIIFSGNGYSPEWKEEAARRGLPNISCTVEAASALTTEKSVKLFEKFKIFTKAELESREEIEYELYTKAINIEARTMIDMVKRQILPAVMDYTGMLADTIKTLESIKVDASVQNEVLGNITLNLKETNQALKVLEEKVEAAKDMENGKDKAFYTRKEIFFAMEVLRRPVDRLETMVDKEIWPMPTYGDLVFEV